MKNLQHPQEYASDQPIVIILEDLNEMKKTTSEYKFGSNDLNIEI